MGSSLSTSTKDHNLGNLYRDQGKLDKAEQMYIRALVGRETELGVDHTSTLDTVNNLGAIYCQRGKLDEAEQMYIRALAGREKALGTDHIATLDTVNNLGILYCTQGKLDKSEQVFMQVLAGRERLWEQTTAQPSILSTILGTYIMPRARWTRRSRCIYGLWLGKRKP